MNGINSQPENFKAVTTKSVSHCSETRRVKIEWQDGHVSLFPYVWLRHQYFFPTLGRPDQLDSDGYKVIESPSELVVESVSCNVEYLLIKWQHDPSESQHSLKTLRSCCLSQEAQSARRTKPKYWLANDAEKFKWFDVSGLKNPKTRLDVFLHLRDYGIALLSNAPCDPGTIKTLAKDFGAVRNTHFGELFDIRSLPKDNKGAGESIGATASNAQAPHMDEGWRHSPIGISFYHCLKAEPSGGGASLFVDAIGAAESLRKINPESFRFLSSVPLVWAAERNPRERFRTRARLIATDIDGTVRGIRLSDRNIPAMDLAMDQIEPAYDALRHFCNITYESKREFEHLFQPGEMAIFDNHRVLHARRAFDPAAGERWIQQLSVDREEFHNLFRQLAESLDRYDLTNWEPDAGVLSQSCG